MQFARSFLPDCLVDQPVQFSGVDRRDGSLLIARDIRPHTHKFVRCWLLPTRQCCFDVTEPLKFKLKLLDSEADHCMSDFCSGIVVSINFDESLSLDKDLVF